MIVWTVRLALACYFVSLAVDLWGSRNERWSRVRRVPWTAGCLLAWAHLAAAFHWRHHWSHAHAAAETSRRTAEMIGWSPGGEIYVNYAFVAVWSLDAIWLWAAPQSYRRRTVLVTGAIHAFLLFVVFNATVVFEDGPIRMAVVGACFVLAALAVRRMSRGAKGGASMA